MSQGRSYIDIIAIHRLNGTWYESLPEIIPYAHVMIYSYNSNYNSMFFHGNDGAICTTPQSTWAEILLQASKVLADYYAAGLLESQWPVIFVTGGGDSELIIRRASYHLAWID